MLEKKVWWDSEHGTEVQTVWFWETGEKQAIPQANKNLNPEFVFTVLQALLQP